MAATFESNYYDYYTWPFGSATDGDAYTHTGGNNAAFNYFSDTPSVGDVFTFGCPEQISGIKLEVGTAMNGTPVFVWEWRSADAAWTTLRVENGNAITKTGTQIVKWTPPFNYQGWALNARPGYQFRMRLTDVTGVTEGGANATNKVQRLQYSFNVTGTSQTMANVYTCDTTTTYTMLSATTPAASLTPIECPFKKSAIVGKLDIILSGCTVGAGDTVVLTGIDYDNAALIETIDVSGSGTATYTTINCFKDVTDVACNGFSDGTILLRTKRIGLIERVGTGTTYTYNIFAQVIFGDNSTTTTVTSTSENWNFMYYATRFCVYGATTTLTLGSMETSGEISYSGGQVFITFTNAGKAFIPRYCLNSGGIINAYGTKFKSTGGSSHVPIVTGMGTWNCKQVSFNMSSFLTWTGTWSNLDGFWAPSLDASYGWPTFTGTANNVVLNNVVTFYNNRNSFILTNGQIEGFSNVNNLDLTRYLKFVDCENLTTTDFTNTAASYQVGDGIYLQKTFKLKVTDSTGVGIPTATVVIKDVLGTTVATLTTDANGDITEQTITWYKGLWTTVSPYSINWTLYTPHTVTISKTGYQTKTIIYTMDRKREEIEVLEKVKDYNFSKRGRVISQ